ncbi:MAG: hypothetical protein ABI301_01670 [Jatrophihabitantaceae bacterium]
MTGTPRVRTLALVETASQLVNVVEWAHAGPATAGVRVAVLAPTDREIRRQLRTVGALATATAIFVRRHELRTGVSGLLRDGPGLLALIARAERLIVGDPFAALVQSLLPLARAEEVVIVADGAASRDFRLCVDAQRPLQRSPVPSRAHRPGRHTLCGHSRRASPAG